MRRMFLTLFLLSFSILVYFYLFNSLTFSQSECQVQLSRFSVVNPGFLKTIRIAESQCKNNPNGLSFYFDVIIYYTTSGDCKGKYIDIIAPNGNKFCSISLETGTIGCREITILPSQSGKYYFKAVYNGREIASDYVELICDPSLDTQQQSQQQTQQQCEVKTPMKLSVVYLNPKHWWTKTAKLSAEECKNLSSTFKSLFQVTLSYNFTRYHISCNKYVDIIAPNGDLFCRAKLQVTGAISCINSTSLPLKSGKYYFKAIYEGKEVASDYVELICEQKTEKNESEENETNTPPGLPPSIYLLELNRGWNMISIPVKNFKINNTDCLISSIWTYEDNKWRKLSKLEDAESGKGYFIYTRNDCSIGLEGDLLDEDRNIKIKRGWNLFGVGGKEISFSELKKQCDGIRVAYIYEKGKWIKNPEKLEVGKAYWIYSRTECDIKV
ncbi:MAG: hypothetical protein QW197_02745 [Candidatus Aenigmatarchaeota archaeon]